MSYVLAVPCSQRVHPGPAAGGGVDVRADVVIDRLAAQTWTTISVGAGAKGPRVYQWARAAIRPLAGPGHWLLARRSLSDPTDIAYYLAAAPPRTPLRELARVAGTRWAIEESFQTAKNEVGLDHYQVRRSPAGTATSPWPCSPTPSSPSPAPAPVRPKKMTCSGTPSARAHDSCVCEFEGA